MAIRIDNGEVRSDTGKWVRRTGGSAWFRRCTALPGDTAEMFEESDTIPEEKNEERPDMQSQLAALARMQARTMSAAMGNAEALSMPDLFPAWEEFIGKEMKQGEIASYGGRLWRSRQAHTAQAMYPPSLNTASLYERIDREHAGTEDDPIPYEPPMEIHEGKWYSQDGVKYRCTRDSGQALSHDLPELVGLYVERA